MPALSAREAGEWEFADQLGTSYPGKLCNQWMIFGKTIHIENRKANHIALCIDTLHDGIVVGFSHIAGSIGEC